jgi:hypothetical protein
MEAGEGQGAGARPFRNVTEIVIISLRVYIMCFTGRAVREMETT